MEGFARALAHRASDREKLLARPRKLLVPDNRTGLLSSPVTSSSRRFHIVGRFGIVSSFCYVVSSFLYGIS